MKKYDEIYTWSGLHGRELSATCRVQVFDDMVFPGNDLCIITELPDNEGTSVTNGIELIVSALCVRDVIDLDRTTVVEHYTAGPHRGDAPETWDIVHFEKRPGFAAGVYPPQWTPTTWDIVRNSAADRHINDWTEL